MLTRKLFPIALGLLVSVPTAHSAVFALSTPIANAAATTAIESSIELKQTLLRIGFTPKALAASGCNTTEVAAAIAALHEHLAESPTAIPEADTACFDAAFALEAVRAAIRSGKATQADLDSLPTLEQALQVATAARDVLIAAATNVVMSELSPAKRVAVETIHANASWNLETYYLVVDRAQASWLELREALDEQRVATKFGEATSQESLTIIATALSNSAVAEAKINLELNLATIKAAWDSAAG